MLSHDEALVHARQHLYSQQPPVEWVWVLRPGQRVNTGWFFWYGLQPLRLIRTSAFPQIGGAPGFLVTDDGAISIVSWSQLQKLLPPRKALEVSLPETMSVNELAKVANENIYTLILLIKEVRIDVPDLQCIEFETAAKILRWRGIIAQRGTNEAKA